MWRAVGVLLLLWVFLGGCAKPGEGIESPQPDVAREEAFDRARRKMVEEQLQGRMERLPSGAISDQRVLEAMGKVPRHRFVPEGYISQAYDERPLPIGEGQTISQPYIVALMTELLKLEEGDRVLEIGTGSGYQAAILAELTPEVYTVEIIEVLGKRAAARLKELDYDEVKTKVDDGYYGWEEYAPFDAIIVTAAPDHVPQPLINQLKDGGVMVIPVGPPGQYQTLWLIERRGEKLLSTSMGGVTFVPFLGGH